MLNRFVNWKTTVGRSKFKAQALGAFCLAVVGMAVFFGSNGGPDMIELRSVQNWSETNAVVTGSTTKRASKRSSSYRPIVAYKYVLEGKTYLGRTRNSEYSGSGNREDAKLVLADFQVGKTISVKYNPADVSQSCHLCTVDPENIQDLQLFLPLLSVVALMSLLSYFYVVNLERT
jgi:hypothetical protein